MKIILKRDQNWQDKNRYENKANWWKEFFIQRNDWKGRPANDGDYGYALDRWKEK